MMLFRYFSCWFTLLSVWLCMTAHAQNFTPSDKAATAETRSLLSNMHRLVGSGVLFGHHDDTAYGVNWRLQPDSSDVKRITGVYPAVYGWDLSGIEADSTHDINGIPFTRQSQLVREAYERGGINTFCWHMNNPATGKTAWDTTAAPVADMLPGGKLHQLYVTYLDRAASYLVQLKGKNGEPIPILFRPFHEMTGGWFWWGQSNCMPEDFIALWRFTINYLRKDKKLHNLLVVFSAADYEDEYFLLERYPGDAYVDIIGFDRYCYGSIKEYEQVMQAQLSILQQVTQQHHKLACIAETGYQGIPLPNWWTDVLSPVLTRYNHTLSYIMLWRNNGLEQYYTPYPGQTSADNFNQFYKAGNMMFQDKLTQQAIYEHK